MKSEFSLNSEIIFKKKKNLKFIKYNFIFSDIFETIKLTNLKF